MWTLKKNELIGTENRYVLARGDLIPSGTTANINQPKNKISGRKSLIGSKLSVYVLEDEGQGTLNEIIFKRQFY